MSYFKKVIRVEGVIAGDSPMDTMVQLSDLASDFEIKTVTPTPITKHIAYWFDIPLKCQEKLDEILNQG